MFNIKYAEVCLSHLVLICWISFNLRSPICKKAMTAFHPGVSSLRAGVQWRDGRQFFWRNLNLLETTDEAAKEYLGVLRRTLKSRVGSKEQGGFCRPSPLSLVRRSSATTKEPKAKEWNPPQKKNTCRDFHVLRKLQIWQWKGTKCFLSRKC